MTEPQALLIIAASEVDANLYYACRFLAPDPFVFLRVGGTTLLLMSDLEIDRARSEARVDEVCSLSAYESKARQRWEAPHLIDTLSLLLEERGVGALTVPANFPVEYADRLREKGVRVTPKPDPFFPERLIKSEEEIAAIQATQRHTEAALEAALNVLRESKIRGEYVYWRGAVLTAEALKKVINVSLMERLYRPAHDCRLRHPGCGSPQPGDRFHSSLRVHRL